MFNVHANTIHYFKRYYNKAQNEVTDRLFRMLSPEYRYGLNAIEHNQKRIMRRLIKFDKDFPEYNLANKTYIVGQGFGEFSPMQM